MNTDIPWVWIIQNSWTYEAREFPELCTREERLLIHSFNTTPPNPPALPAEQCIRCTEKYFRQTSTSSNCMNFPFAIKERSWAILQMFTTGHISLKTKQ